MIASLFTNFACGGGGFLGFPHWYDYLPKVTDAAGCTQPAIHSIGDFWLVVAAVIEILLRVAALVAVFAVVYGGILYTISQGDPDKTNQAKNSIVNGVIGLAITVIAAATVAFIAGSIH